VRAPASSLARLLKVEPVEFAALAWALLYFFSLLCGYYVLRPVRDAMGIAGGVQHLPWLFTGTFLAMLAAVPLFGWVASRYPRRRFVPIVYGFFIANVLLFWLMFRAGVHAAWVARAFFIWTSVFNLFVVSVFWSFMNDIFTTAQAKRLFGAIAAGGTAGALAGPAIATALAVPLGAENLLLISAGFLGVAIVCIGRLISWHTRVAAAANDRTAFESHDAPAMGGGVLEGVVRVVRSPYMLGICLFMLLFTTLSTFLYFAQAEIVRDAFTSSAERTRVFGAMDLAVNGITVATQLLLTARVVDRFGVARTLAAVPLVLSAGFVALALAPTLGVLVVVQVLRRAGDYAITRPAREMLYGVLGREDKYKAKNFIDTAVYRGGDAVSAWAFAGLRALGLGLGAIAWIGVPLALSWAWLALRLGRRREAIAGAPGSLDSNAPARVQEDRHA